MNKSHTDKLCTTCGKVHAFPAPKFTAGQRVRLVSDAGYHHTDKVGQVTTIIRVVTFLVDPCDKVEYETGFGHGNILECRLEAEVTP
jgi:hypothetical protein